MVLILKYFGSEVMLPYFLFTLRKFLAERLDLDESGQTLVEYSLLLLLIAIVVIGAVLIVGEQINILFQSVIDEWPPA